MSPSGIVPNRERNISQPFTAPGTVIEYTPLCGMRVWPFDLRNSAVSPDAAQPPELRP